MEIGEISARPSHFCAVSCPPPSRILPCEFRVSIATANHAKRRGHRHESSSLTHSEDDVIASFMAGCYMRNSWNFCYLHTRPSSVRVMRPLTLETFRVRMRDCRHFLYPSVVNFLIMWRLEREAAGKGGSHRSFLRN